MGIKERLADECGVGIGGIVYTTGRMHIQKMQVGPSTGTYVHIGDANTALLASQTNYYILGRVPSYGVLKSAIIRSSAVGVAGASISILSCASGTAMAAGTAMVTPVAGNGITANTDYTFAIVTTGGQNIAAGSVIVLKVITGGAETLKPVMVDLEIAL